MGCGTIKDGVWTITEADVTPTKVEKARGIIILSCLALLAATAIVTPIIISKRNKKSERK